MPDLRIVSGGCLCEQVRFQATGEPLNVALCHCRLCQKATGQAFFARAVYPRAAVSIEGETAAYSSSPELARHFCPRCGTPVFVVREGTGIISVALGALDEPGALSPEANLYSPSAVTWLGGIDSLPKLPAGWLKR